MIQIYKPTNTNYINNGDSVLFPISADIDIELNGSWLLTLSVPLDEEGRYKLIETNAVIKAPSINGEQLFRIRKTEKQDGGVVATAEPIFLDAVGDCFLMDVRPTNKNGAEALSDILSPNSKYSGRSNITARNTAYFVRKNAMEAIAGTEDASFLSRWGGEIVYNNFEIIINERAGADYGVSLLYGKNIPTGGVRETVDVEGVVTRIIPKAYNGYMLSGSTPWVNSPIINSYPTIYTKVIDYENIRLYSDVEGDNTEGLIICQTEGELQTALRNAASEEFQNGIDKPIVTIEADMVLLQNTEEYKDYQNLETVSIGDTIHLKHKKLGIESTARIVALTFDAIGRTVTKVTIGDVVPSFIDRVASSVHATEKAITKSGEVKAEQVKGFIDGVNAQLRIQSTVAERQNAIAIMFEDLDPSSPTYGASAYGTQGWQISSERTPDGRDWVWTTAGTSKGIIADTITAGTLSAIDIDGVNITGGTITGTTINNGNGTFRVDANGNLTATSALITGDISGSNITGSTITGSTISSTWTSSGSVTRIASLNDGQVVFTQENSTNPATNSTTTITGGGLTYERPNAAVATRTTVGGSVTTQLLSDTTQAASLSYNQISITKTQSDRISFSPEGGYIVRGGQYVWRTEHGNASSVSFTGGVFAGYVTNSTTSIDFFIPVSIPIMAGITASVTIPSDCQVRTISGYIDGTQYLSASGKTITTVCQKEGVRVRITKSSAYTNVSNNTPVSVYGSFTITFTA